MADYDSDSSGANDIETGVTLGYATKEPTGDDFSQLGGHPIWLDDAELPPGDLAKCRVCNGLLNALFQLNGDLPDRYPGHERRLYIFGCRRKQCRRKEGSIRGLRYSKIDAAAATKAAERKNKPDPAKAAPAPTSTLGNTLFGVTGSTASANANPFGAPSTAASSNPFAKPSAASQPAPIAELTQTFAEKAKIGVSNTPKKPQGPAVPWPAVSTFPQPYPSYYIDADKEFLDPEPAAVPQQVRIAELEDEPGSSSGGGGDDKTTFESSMDKTFQKFADRLEQNPEQVLRYEFGGQPLLYSKTDAVGKAWPRVPRCAQCAGQRQFELQLTPHAITELEADDISLEGMDWGTVILAVCGNDCAGWSEEWIGVQWEETSGKKP